VIRRLKHILLEPLFLFRLEIHVLWAWIFIQNRQAQRDDTPVHSCGLDNGRVGITVGSKLNATVSEGALSQADMGS
jgi:hypothetical protein